MYSKLFNQFSIRLLATVLLCASCSLTGLYAQKNDYTFKHKTVPTSINRYLMALFMIDGNSITGLNGAQYAQVDGQPTDLSVSPAGLNFVVLSKNKKGVVDAYVYSTRTSDSCLEKFSAKKFGTPHAVTYTPDARKILLATDAGLHLIDAKTFEKEQLLALDFVPDEMLMSSDGYYLVIANNHNVIVYNFEERNTRKTWKFDEKVTAVGFDDENDQFGILTDDGLLSIYDTRNFGLKHTVDELGDALDFSFNDNGKYAAVAVSPDKIVIVNTLKDNEREVIDIPDGMMSELLFFHDVQRNTLLANNTLNAVLVKRIHSITPYYGKLIADEVADRMNDWLKMAPGESMEDYRARVNDETRARQQRLFEDEISTQFADNLLSMSTVSLGKYDRGNQILEVDFDNMPSIFLPVAETDLVDFKSADDLEFYDTKYGIMPDDNFELIYARIHHKGTGKSYIYDNLDRKPLSFLEGDDNLVSIEMIQQQQFEEIKLQELKEQIVAEAKSQNVISDHTNISVDSRVEPSYDANGKKILNYVISFAYEVDPGFSVHEDFGPGKYHVDESGAASSMLKIVKEAFEGDFAQYVKDGKKVNVKISGTADATPIMRVIKYDGVYGDFENEIVFKNGQMTGISVNEKDGITENEQLAFLRAYGVRDFIGKNIPELDKMNANYQYDIAVAEGKGSEFRRITAEFTLVDIY